MLNKIIAEKKKEVKKARVRLSLEEMAQESRKFLAEIRDFALAIAQDNKISLIAEIKQASPSKGILRQDFHPVRIAEIYAGCGAAALSVLTDKKFFQGDIRYLRDIRQAVKLPLLRKDFIIDEYQIYESVCAGADAVLLITRLLSKEQFGHFYALSKQLRLSAVCEVHNEADLDKALEQDAAIIGINNRNLQTFAEDLQTTERLMRRIPKGKIVISESAIRTPEDVRYLQELGVNAVLIGEALMRSENIRAKARELMGY